MVFFLIFLLIPVGLMLWQFAEAAGYPLNRRSSQRRGGLTADSFAPPITILKPLKGCDSETAACLQSWLHQDYPGPVQILFGVANPEDPVCELVRKLMAGLRATRAKATAPLEAELVICSQQLGTNAKVSTLVQLERLARHDVLIVSDADVYVPPDLLGEIVLPFQNRETGLVNCFYRLAKPANLAMRLESFAINADFWSQVLQAQRLQPIDFALGAVMATTRERLGKIGGFAALVDYLADDYQLGHRIAQTGGRVAICPLIVECRNAPMSAREVWAHQVRWARTVRVCRPGSYFLSVLNIALFWPVLFCVLHPVPPMFVALGICWLIRGSTAFVTERKFTGQGEGKVFWMGPLKDLLQFVLWLLAFLGSGVHWRGHHYRVMPGGKLVKA